MRAWVRTADFKTANKEFTFLPFFRSMRSRPHFKTTNQKRQKYRDKASGKWALDERNYKRKMFYLFRYCGRTILFSDFVEKVGHAVGVVLDALKMLG